MKTRNNFVFSLEPTINLVTQKVTQAVRCIKGDSSVITTHHFPPKIRIIINVCKSKGTAPKLHATLKRYVKDTVSALFSIQAFHNVGFLLP